MTSRCQGTDKLPTTRHVAPAGTERIDTAIEDTGGTGTREHSGHTAEFDLTVGLGIDGDRGFTFKEDIVHIEFATVGQVAVFQVDANGYIIV